MDIINVPLSMFLTSALSSWLSVHSDVLDTKCNPLVPGIMPGLERFTPELTAGTLLFTEIPIPRWCSCINCVPWPLWRTLTSKLWTLWSLSWKCHWNIPAFPHGTLPIPESFLSLNVDSNHGLSWTRTHGLYAPMFLYFSQCSSIGGLICKIHQFSLHFQCSFLATLVTKTWHLSHKLFLR